MLNIVIPMAGAGSRFADAGYEEPKPLIPVHGRPMIEVVIRNLTPSIPHKFIFICQKTHVVNYGLSEKLSAWAPNCEVLTLDELTEGAACTVLIARQLIDSDSPLMIANCDQYVDTAIDAYLECLNEKDLDGLIMTMSANDPKWSFVELDNNNFVTRVVEKEVISEEATVGIYNFATGKDFVTGADEMISCEERVNGEFYVAPVYNRLIKKKRRVGIYNIGTDVLGMYGLGTPSDLNYFLSLPKFNSLKK